MRISIFSKIFLFSILFLIIPLIILAVFFFLDYENAARDFFEQWQRPGMPGIAEQSLQANLARFKTYIALALFIVIFFILVSNILLSWYLSRSLKKIIQGIKEVDKGNLDFLIEIKNKDELGEIARHFNEMTQRLKKITTDLEEAKNTLEIRVAARTRELQELTASREETVRQRTKELVQRLQELEKFHRLAVGRELKIIELKKEVSQLKSLVSQKTTKNKVKNKSRKQQNSSAGNKKDE